MSELPFRQRIGRSKEFLWGFVSQGASSATNLGLSLLAGRVLGPEGLGVVFVGFSLYLFVLGLQRALLTDPVVAVSTTLSGDKQTFSRRAALSAALLFGLIAALLAVCLGLILPSDLGEGVMLFSVWLVPALLQDYWRILLFQQRKGRAGALNDLIWVAVMAASAPAAIALKTPWAVVGCWGLGALGGAIAGAAQLRLRPLALRAAWTWWKTKAWPMGRWLGIESLTYGAATQGVIFVLAAILGAEALGGLRAVQSIFAPLSLLGPAIGLPAFPEVSRRLAISESLARRLVIRLGLMASVVTVAYLALTISGGAALLSFAYGSGFIGFEGLIWPIGAAQLLTGALIGVPILLKAQRRSRPILTATFLGSVVGLLTAPALALTAGVTGAAWGLASGSAVRGLSMTVFAGKSRVEKSIRIPRTKMGDDGGSE